MNYLHLAIWNNIFDKDITYICDLNFLIDLDLKITIYWAHGIWNENDSHMTEKQYFVSMDQMAIGDKNQSFV